MQPYALDSNVRELAKVIGQTTGKIVGLETENKTDLVSAINELNGKLNEILNNLQTIQNLKGEDSFVAINKG